MAMAAGDYVSVSSQVDVERADRAMEERELAGNPQGELRELTGIYEARGLPSDLARQVALQWDVGLVAEGVGVSDGEGDAFGAPLGRGVLVDGTGLGRGASRVGLGAVLILGVDVVCTGVGVLAGCAVAGGATATVGVDGLTSTQIKPAAQVITSASACRCLDASERTNASVSLALALIRSVILPPSQVTRRASKIAPVTSRTISRPLLRAHKATSVRGLAPENIALHRQ
jgi:hypothetical protein